MSPSSPEPGPPAPCGRFIPGVYNYCDRWCERCTLSSRCRVFQHNRALEAARAAGLSLEQAMDRAEAAVELLEGPPPPVAPAWELERDALIEAASGEPTKEEIARWEALEKRRRAWVEVQPLTRSSQDYLHLSLDVVAALQTLIGTDSDPIAVAALQAIHHHAFLIPSKVHRALSGSWRVFDRTALVHGDDDDDADEIGRYGANGSAHVALRAMVESREAWEVVAANPRFASSGVAPSMIRRLRELEADLSAQFPGALTFKRPGFDEGAAFPP